MKKKKKPAKRKKKKRQPPSDYLQKKPEVKNGNISDSDNSDQDQDRPLPSEETFDMAQIRKKCKILGFHCLL